MGWASVRARQGTVVARSRLGRGFRGWGGHRRLGLKRLFAALVTLACALFLALPGPQPVSVDPSRRSTAFTDYFAARAERLCISGDCPCFDEPYRTQCFAEQKAAYESANPPQGKIEGVCSAEYYGYEDDPQTGRKVQKVGSAIYAPVRYTETRIDGFSEVSTAWDTFLKANYFPKQPEANGWRWSVRCQVLSAETAQERHKNDGRNWESAKAQAAYQRVFLPTYGVEEGGLASKRHVAIVNLRGADPGKGERGFHGLAFNIEYQFLVCQGELHIAYSLLEDSVRQRPDTTMRPVYVLDHKFHTPSAIPTHIISAPITGTVADRWAKLIGKFGDNFAAKALGFGCFTGQTQKLGNMKDYLPQNAEKAQVQEFLDSLEAFIKTTEVYQSADAEDEINRFLREHPGEKAMSPASARHYEEATADRARAERTADEARKDEQASAAEAARRRKEELAREDEARKAEYNRQMEEHQKAVEEHDRQVAAAAQAQREFEAKLAENERQNAETRRQFEVQQAEYQRQRAEWEAQTAQLRK